MRDYFAQFGAGFVAAGPVISGCFGGPAVPPRPRAASGVGRASGAILDPTHDDPDASSFTAPADFSIAGESTEAGAYFVMRDSADPRAWMLLRGTSARVLRDAIDTVHTASEAPPMYTQDLLARFVARFRSISPMIAAPAPLSPADGGRLTPTWLKLILFTTYGGQLGHDPNVDVVLPTRYVAPSLGGAEWTLPEGHADDMWVNHRFTGDGIPGSPFPALQAGAPPGHVYESDEFFDGGGGGGSSGGGGLVALVLLGLGVAAASEGR